MDSMEELQKCTLTFSEIALCYQNALTIATEALKIIAIDGGTTMSPSLIASEACREITKEMLKAQKEVESLNVGTGTAPSSN